MNFVPCCNEKLLPKQMRGWKLREVECLAPSHTAFQEQTGMAAESRDRDPYLLQPMKVRQGT